MSNAEVVIKVKLDDSDAEKGLKDIGKQATDAGDKAKRGERGFVSLNGAIKTVAIGAVAAVGALAALGYGAVKLTKSVVSATQGLFDMTYAAAQAGDAIHKGAPKLGVTTDAYQEMQYWASQNGLAHSSLDRAVGRLNQRIGLALNGNEKYADAFASLGVSVLDANGYIKDTDQVLGETIANLSALSDAQTRSAMASDLFGTRMARDLLPVLEEGAMSLEEAKERAHELGLVLSNPQVNISAVFNDTMDDLERSVAALKNKLGIELIPAFKQLVDFLIGNMPRVRDVLGGAFEQIAGSLEYVFATLNYLSPTIGWVFDQIIAKITGVIGIAGPGGLIGVFRQLSAWAVTNAPLIAEYLVDAFDRFIDKTIQVGVFVWGLVQALWQLITTIASMVAALQAWWNSNPEWLNIAIKGAGLLTAGLVILGSITARIVTIGTALMPVFKAVGTIFVSIGGAVVKLGGAFKAVLPIVMGLGRVLMFLFTGIPGIILAVVTMILAIFPGVRNFLIDIFRDAIEGIKNLFMGLFSWLSDAWKGIKGFFGFDTGPEDFPGGDAGYTVESGAEGKSAEEILGVDVDENGLFEGKTLEELLGLDLDDEELDVDIKEPQKQQFFADDFIDLESLEEAAPDDLDIPSEPFDLVEYLGLGDGVGSGGVSDFDLESYLGIGSGPDLGSGMSNIDWGILAGGQPGVDTSFLNGFSYGGMQDVNFEQTAEMQREQQRAAHEAFVKQQLSRIARSQEVQEQYLSNHSGYLAGIEAKDTNVYLDGNEITDHTNKQNAREIVRNRNTAGARGGRAF